MSVPLAEDAPHDEGVNRHEQPEPKRAAHNAAHDDLPLVVVGSGRAWRCGGGPGVGDAPLDKVSHARRRHAVYEDNAHIWWPASFLPMAD